MLPRESITYERPAPSWPWRLAVFATALGMTAVTALLVPLADLFTKAPARSLEYRTIEVSEWRPPPPPAPLPVPRPVTPAPAPPPAAKAAVPRLEAPTPQATERLKLPVKLEFALGDFRSDLTLDFDADPTAGGALPGVATATAPAAPAAPAPPPAPAAAVDDSEPLDRHPAILTQSRPVYPYRARSRRVEGYVDLQFTVTPHGSVDTVAVVAGQPQGVFEEAAVAAVRTWRFSPGIRDGQPVPVRMQIRIRFDLTE